MAPPSPRARRIDRGHPLRRIAIAGTVSKWHSAQAEADRSEIEREASDIHLAWQQVRDGDIGAARQTLAGHTGTDHHGFAMGYLRSITKPVELSRRADAAAEWTHSPKDLDQKIRDTASQIFDTPPTCLAATKEGNTIVAGGADGTVRVKNKLGQLLAKLDLRNGQRIANVATIVSPDIFHIAAIDEAGTMVKWDFLKARKPRIARLQHLGEPIEFSPDDSEMAVAYERGGKSGYWLADVSAGIPRHHSCPAIGRPPIRFFHDGKTASVVIRNDGLLAHIRLADGAALELSDGWRKIIQQDEAGIIVKITTGVHAQAFTDPRRIGVYRLDGGTPETALIKNKGASHLAISPDGNVLAIADDADRSLSLYSTITLKPLIIFDDRLEWTSLQFSSTGRYLVAGSAGNQLNIIDTETGSP